MGNRQNGIVVFFGATANLVDDNAAMSNRLAGIAVGGPFFAAPGNTLTNNTLTSNGTAGVDAESANTWVSGNRAVTNVRDGIDVFGAGSTVRSSTALSNGGHGMVAGAGVTDGGGNLGLGNKTPPNCINVDCSIHFLFF